MGWILMQPADDAESQIDNTHLKILENAYSYSLKMAPDWNQLHLDLVVEMIWKVNTIILLEK